MSAEIEKIDDDNTTWETEKKQYRTCQKATKTRFHYHMCCWSTPSSWAFRFGGTLHHPT